MSASAGEADQPIEREPAASARWIQAHPFLELLLAEDRRATTQVVAAATFAGLSQGLVIAVINSASGAVEQQETQVRLLVLFFVLMLAYAASRAHALDKGASVVEAMIRGIRSKVVRRIRAAPLEEVERLENSWVLGVLSRDAEVLSNLTPMILNGCASLVTLGFACVYIAAMSKIALVFTAALIFTGAAFVLGKVSFIEETMAQASRTQDHFMSKLTHLLDGFKAVKHHSELGRDLEENYLLRATQDLEVDMLAGRLAINTNILFSQSFFYLLLATIVFLLPSFANFDSSRVTHLVAMILFLLGPITEVVGAIPFLTQADVAARNLRQVHDRLDVAETEDPSSPEAVRLAAEVEMEVITARGLEYDYLDHDGQLTFQLGPLDFGLRRGELVFLVGGNGSGKSTLLKTFTGLYQPGGGELTFNGIPVTDRNRARYREWFSPIYADFHLFDRLYGMQESDPARVSELLETMGIAHKTQFEGGRFTRLDLSTGQRKRLALVVALLEDRPVFVFDEVAADQDPEFRTYFYQSLLPELRARGKAGIVVTHDDRYFHLADRLVRMKDGRFLSEEDHVQAC